MLDRFTYTNHYGEIIEFGQDNIIIDSNELRNYSWEYSNYYNKASGFKKRMRSTPLTVLIYGDNANATADRIYEVLEKDVLENKHGKITINDYYTYCYFYSSEKVSYTHNGILKLLFYIVIDSKNWIKESYFKFRPDEEIVGEWLTYPHGFPFTYKREKRSVSSLFNDSFVPQNMKITIYGACVNPTVIIAEHNYKLNIALSESEYAVIDTLEKTITKYSDTGAETNIFSSRDITSYIFEKVPTGTHDIQTLPSNVNVDIAIMEERSEPRWTLKEQKKKDEKIAESQSTGTTVYTDYTDAYIDESGCLIFTNNDGSMLDLELRETNLYLISQ